jgi:sensor histidine kinase regulating citrate/malate metabolism
MSAMRNPKIAEILVFFACLAVLALPVLNSLVVTPAFTEFLKHVAEKELFKAASKMSTLIGSAEDLSAATAFPPEFIQHLEIDRTLLNLTKVKIFTRSGLRIYSTDHQEIGGYSQQDFFPALVANRETRSEISIDKTSSAEQERYLVETYVPIIKNDRVTGVFEIYYDISETRQKLAKVLSSINWIVICSSLLLLLAVLVSSYLTRRNSLLREKVEAEKDRLIQELSRALAELKTLRGILPLCSFCKKIRDDKGYWEQVDVYIAQHSDANISHGICPDCAAEHYPDLYHKIPSDRGKRPEDNPPGGKVNSSG